jgi:hypothetical protein
VTNSCDLFVVVNGVRKGRDEGNSLLSFLHLGNEWERLGLHALRVGNLEWKCDSPIR